jgi:hypothetical protein
MFILCGPIQPLLYSSNLNRVVGFEIITAVVMKSTVFLDIALRSPLKVNGRLEEYRLQLQDRRISRARNQR